MEVKLTKKIETSIKKVMAEDIDTVVANEVRRGIRDKIQTMLKSKAVQARIEPVLIKAILKAIPQSVKNWNTSSDLLDDVIIKMVNSKDFKPEIATVLKDEIIKSLPKIVERSMDNAIITQD